MKTEQEQIEKMRRTIYNTRSKVNGIATAGDIAEALVQAGYGDVSEYKAEIERLKDDYAKLQEQFAQYQMASDKEIIAQKKEAEQLFESNMKAVLEIEKKQSQIDVLNKLKDSYGLYYLSAFGVKERMLADVLNPMIEELKK